MYKYFIHIGVDPLDLILQQIIDSDVWDEETVFGRNDLTCINCVLNGWLQLKIFFCEMGHEYATSM